MHILRRPPWFLPAREITPEPLWRSRRDIVRLAGAGLVLGALGVARIGTAAPARNPAFSTGEEPSSEEAITSYNNYYEFGTDKSDPARHAGRMLTRPWTVRVEGHVEHPGSYDIADLIRDPELEERVYRLRCVEAWSMVVPWYGVPLAAVIRRLGPTSKAKFVQFETLADRTTMPGLAYPVLDWPYVEGLRLDEALHPLALLATGLYGKPLPNQNGAPLRLVVPWKYGFKSIKSIVAMRFVERQPATSWNRATPREYGFYSNVNPEVSHPRWSQASERRIGEFRRRPTLMFNGYGDLVAPLYAGMDLKKNF